jgi:hypothetical protein
VIEYRAYAAAKRVYDVHPAATGDLVQLVKEIEFDLTAEELAQKKRDGQ